MALRGSLANVRARRITPTSIMAPSTSTFVPPAYGPGIPSKSDAHIPRGTSGQAKHSESNTNNSNLQEARVERDAWRGIAETLTKMNMIHSKSQEMDMDHE